MAHAWPVWPDSSGLFSDLPLARSTAITGVAINSSGPCTPPGKQGSDTFYPAWADDGLLYTPWTDGGLSARQTVGGGRAICAPSDLCASSCGPCGAGPNGTTTGAHGEPNNGSFVQQGWAIASGATESTMTFIRGGVFNGSSALPWQGRYPSASLVYKGVWYMGTYALAELWGNRQFPCKNWCVMGPFVGFRHSSDHGANWVEPRRQMASDFASYSAASNLFGEAGPQCLGQINNTVPRVTDACNDFMNPHDCSPYTCVGTWRGKVKMGAPHVVDLGRELAHARAADPDGKPRAYLIGHGATLEHQPHSWMQGSQVYLARTRGEPSVAVMTHGEHWEFYAGRRPGGDVRWATSVADAVPILSWENKTGATTLTYVPALRRFIMCVGTPAVRSGVGAMAGDFDTYLLESERITGPYRMITYLRSFGPQAYFVNLVSRLLSEEVETDTDGQRFVEGSMSYSANFGDLNHSTWPNPSNTTTADGGYRWTLLRVRLLLAAKAKSGERLTHAITSQPARRIELTGRFDL